MLPSNSDGALQQHFGSITSLKFEMSHAAEGIIIVQCNDRRIAGETLQMRHHSINNMEAPLLVSPLRS